MHYAEYGNVTEEIDVEGSGYVEVAPRPWRVQSRPAGQFAGAGIGPSPWLVQSCGKFGGSSGKERRDRGPATAR